MAMSPTIPPGLRHKLLIVELPDSKKVQFSDFNEVRNYNVWEPPIAVSGKSQPDINTLDRLLEAVYLLEQQRDQQAMEIKKLNSQLSEIVSSVASTNFPPAANQKWNDWHNSEAPVVRQLPEILKTAPVAPPPRTEPAKPQPQIVDNKPSASKRALMVLGVFTALFGGVAGLLSCIALGPLGIPIAVGAYFIGAGIYEYGKSIK